MIKKIRNALKIHILSKEKTFIRFQGEVLLKKDEKKYLEDYIKKIKVNKAVKLMVFHDKQLIGMADITMEDKISVHVGLFGITVLKEFRGQGIGKLLIDLIINEAKKNIKQLKIIILSVFDGNDRAKNLYKSFGFINYGMLPKGIKYKGEYINHYYMYKNIT